MWEEEKLALEKTACSPPLLCPHPIGWNMDIGRTQLQPYKWDQHLGSRGWWSKKKEGMWLSHFWTVKRINNSIYLSYSPPFRGLFVTASKTDPYTSEKSFVEGEFLWNPRGNLERNGKVRQEGWKERRKQSGRKPHDYRIRMNGLLFWSDGNFLEPKNLVGGCTVWM